MNNDIVTLDAKEKVFLDTAFLASFSIDNHKDFSKAQTLLSEIVLKYEMHTSPLCFYELWQVVKKHSDYYRGNKCFLRKFNRMLKFINIKILFE
jgi:predicted nucleic acid-binding protein